MVHESLRVLVLRVNRPPLLVNGLSLNTAFSSYLIGSENVEEELEEVVSDLQHILICHVALLPSLHDVFQALLEAFGGVVGQVWEILTGFTHSSASPIECD